MALRCRRVGAVHSIISGHSRRFARCPLFPRKRTSAEYIEVSALGQQQTSPPCSRLLEHFYDCEGFSRPRPEAVQCELCLLSGLYLNEEVIVLLFGRLA